MQLWALVLELGPSPVEPRVHRAHRHAELGSNGIAGFLANYERDKDIAEIGVERLEHGLYPTQGLTVFDDLDK